MELKDIISIPGKPGLYKVFKPTRNGLIVEPLTQKGPKTIVSSNQRVSALKEISIFVTNDAESTPLENVLNQAYNHYKGKAEFDIEDTLTLRTEFETVLPSYDAERVKVSDMKKFFKWFNILAEFVPEIFAQPDAVLEAEPQAEQTQPVQETQTVEPMTEAAAIDAESSEKPKKSRKSKKDSKAE